MKDKKDKARFRDSSDRYAWLLERTPSGTDSLFRLPSSQQSELIDRARVSQWQHSSSSTLDESKVRVPRTFNDYFKAVFAEANDIMVSRQGSYGPANVESLGPHGVFSRMAMDKVNRIARAMNGKIVDGRVEMNSNWYTPEVHDALIDTINYAAILIALGQEKWSEVSRGDDEEA
jgi:hypothetical protein